MSSALKQKSPDSIAVAVLAVTAGATLGASSGLYIKGLAFSSLAMASFRLTVPFLLTLPSAARHGLLFGPKAGTASGLSVAAARKLRNSLIVASVLNAVRMLLYVLSLKLTSIGNAIVLLYLWPVFSLVMDSLRTKRPLEASRAGILALATAGVIAMNLSRGFAFGGADFLGSLCMIASAFIYAGINMVFKDALSVMSEYDTLYFQNAAGGIFFLPFLLAELPKVPASHFGLGMVYGVVVGLVGIWFFSVAMKRLPMFQYSTLSYVEIPVGVLLGIVFRGESLALSQVVGFGLILCGSVLAQRVRTAGAPRAQERA